MAHAKNKSPLSLAYQMRSTFRECETQMGRFLNDLDVPLSYYYILRTEWVEEGISQKQLATDAAITPSVASQVIQKMCKENLLTRKTSSNDSRIKLVFITKQGEALRDKLNGICESLLEQACQNIPAEDIAIATQVLSGLHVNIQTLKSVLHETKN